MATPTYRNALPLGTQLQEYRLDAVLGAGAFGMTYLAWDTHLEKKVALKEYLPTEFAVRALDGSVLPVTSESQRDYRWGLDRFLLEARTLARFSHPNIVRINRYFETNGTAYVVMDYEEGESLAQVLRQQPQPTDEQILKIALPLLDGLEAVHEAGFLHRDIKPANVYIRRNGTPVLLDFGAARQALGGATKSLTAVLTPGYAPIEQYATDGNQGPWTDIYALGGVLYRALLNENPPEATSRLRNDAVPAKLRTMRGRVGVFLLSAIDWALALDEKQRPQNVREWRDAIERQKAAQASPSPAADTSPARAGTPVRPPHAVAPPRPPQPRGTASEANTAEPGVSPPAPAANAAGATNRVVPVPAARPPTPNPAAAPKREPAAVARIPRTPEKRTILTINLGWVAVFAAAIGGTAWIARSREPTPLIQQQGSRIIVQTENGTITLPGRLVSGAPGSPPQAQPTPRAPAPPSAESRSSDVVFATSPTSTPGTNAHTVVTVGTSAAHSLQPLPDAAEPAPQATAPVQPAVSPYRVDLRTVPYAPPSGRPAEAAPTGDRLFAEADINQDGHISREESLRFPPLVRHFERIDANSDGLLSLREFDRIRPLLGPAPPPQHARPPR